MEDLDVEPTEQEPTGPTASNRTARRWIVLAVVVAVLAVGGVAAAVIANRDDGPAYDRSPK